MSGLKPAAFVIVAFALRRSQDLYPDHPQEASHLHTVHVVGIPWQPSWTHTARQRVRQILWTLPRIW